MKTLGEFRKLTAKLPDSTPLLTDAPDQCYRNPGCSVTTAIYHICAVLSGFEPDCGDDPELYGHSSVEAVKKARQTVVVVS